MECLLCNMWTRMPYAKRYSTPTTPAETEGALVIGYWVATRQQEGVVRLCPRHMAVVENLDNQEEARKKAIQEQQDRLAQHFQERVAEIQQRKEQLLANVPKEPVQADSRDAVLAIPKPNPPKEVVIGPGPLTSDNVVNVQPPAPPPINTTPPIVDISGQLVVPNSPATAPLNNPNLPQAAAQGAALIDAPCLFCKVMVKTGEVHNCPMAAGRGN